MKLSEAVAKRTSDLLKSKNISQYRLSKESLIYKSTIQRILKNKTKHVKLETIVAITLGLGISIKEFFDDDIFRHENIELE